MTMDVSYKVYKAGNIEGTVRMLFAVNGIFY